MSRKFTNMLIDMLDDRVIAARAVADMCLQYMSESDVEDMMHANDLLDDDDDDDDDDDE